MFDRYIQLMSYLPSGFGEVVMIPILLSSPMWFMTQVLVFLELDCTVCSEKVSISLILNLETNLSFKIILDTFSTSFFNSDIENKACDLW